MEPIRVRSSFSNGNGFGSVAEQDLRNDAFPSVSFFGELDIKEDTDDIEETQRLEEQQQAFKEAVKQSLKTSNGLRGIDALSPSTDVVIQRKESKASPSPIGHTSSSDSLLPISSSASFFAFPPSSPSKSRNNSFASNSSSGITASPSPILSSVFHSTAQQSAASSSSSLPSSFNYPNPALGSHGHNSLSSHSSPSAHSHSNPSPHTISQTSTHYNHFGDNNSSFSPHHSHAQTPNHQHNFSSSSLSHQSTNFPTTTNNNNHNNFPLNPHISSPQAQSLAFSSFSHSSSASSHTQSSSQYQQPQPQQHQPFQHQPTLNHGPNSLPSMFPQPGSYAPHHMSKLFGSANPLSEALHAPGSERQLRGGSAPPYIGGPMDHRRQKERELGRRWSAGSDLEFDSNLGDFDEQFSALSLSAQPRSLTPLSHNPSASPAPGAVGDDEYDEGMFGMDDFGNAAMRSPSPPVRDRSMDAAEVNQLLSNFEVPYSPVYGEHPLGEHPSRTLFVRNINSNVEDDELAQLFEQHGPIRSMYTQCKHRGFVMISYFDIRHAKNAMRFLQGRILRRRKLDIHYSIPKDNPSEKDQNQGTLVVFNLDPATTNEELKNAFGAYGEIKEIRETPNKKHHKFVEFYDVRDADKAMKGLNKTEIRGKKIKIEPSRPGGARKMSLPHAGAETLLDEETLNSLAMSNNGSTPHSMSPLGMGVMPDAASPHFGGTSSLSPTHSFSPSSQQNQMAKFKNSPSITNSSAFEPVSPPLYRTQSPTFANSGLYPHSREHSPAPTPVHHTMSSPSGSPARGFVSGTVVSRSNSFDNPTAPGSAWTQPTMNNSPSRSLLGAAGGPDRTSSPFELAIPPSSPIHFGFSPVASPSPSPTPMDQGGIKHERRHRSDSGEEKGKFALNLSRVRSAIDTRTTLMIKNIPNKYTQKMLLAAVDERHKGTYDFFYLPIDFKNKCNVGYAFINMIALDFIPNFYEEFNNKKWEKFNSEKVCEITYARIQGKHALINHFQNSSLMSEDKKCRPIIFHSDGPNAGEPEPFPLPAALMRRRGSSSGSQDELRITSVESN